MGRILGTAGKRRMMAHEVIEVEEGKVTRGKLNRKGKEKEVREGS